MYALLKIREAAFLFAWVTCFTAIGFVIVYSHVTGEPLPHRPEWLEADAVPYLFASPIGVLMAGWLWAGNEAAKYEPETPVTS